MKKLVHIILVLMACVAAKAQLPSNGLVERFTFDNTLVGTAGTVLGAANQGNFVADQANNPSSAHNISISSQGFNGFTMAGLPLGNADRTVCFWFKSNSNGIHSLFNYSTVGNTFAIAYVNSPQTLIVSNGPQESSIPFTYTSNWTHLTVVHENGVSKVYVNGAVVGSFNITYAVAANPTGRIGFSPGGTYYGNFRMNDLLVYSRALTDQEVLDVVTLCPGPSNITPSNNLTVCSGGNTTLSAVGSGPIGWYAESVGGTLLAVGENFTTPPITENITYYASDDSAGCNSERTPITITAVPTPVGTITLSNDTIRATNLFDTYVLKKDGVPVFGGNTGSFAVPATQCGSYQAEFTNTVNSCGNIGITISRQVAPCATYLNISNIQFPVTYNYAFGTPPGAPSITANQNPISIPVCTNVQLNMNIRGANGCEYTLSFQTISLTNGPVTLSRPSTSDSTTSCTIYSNIIQIAPQGPTNTTAAPFLSICSGSSTTLSATGAGTLEWYDQPTGGNLLGTGASFNTPAISSNTTFYVQSVSGGCNSARTAVAVTVNPLPAMPVSNTPPANLSICSGNSTVLSVVAPPNGIGTFWSMLPQGGSSFASGNSVTISANSLTATDTFYVGHVNINNNCNSALIPLIVTVNTAPAAPVNTSGSNQTICSGSATTLTVTGSDTLKWYANAVGGVPLTTGLVYATPALSNATSYYVSSNNANCSSARTEIQVTVNQVPPVPTNTTAQANLSRCAGSSTTLTATTGFAGAQVKWYTQATGGTAVHTGGSYNTPPLSATDTFYVAAETALCPSARVAIIVTVNPVPSASVTPATATVCNGGSVQYTAAGGLQYAWSNSGGSNAQATFTPTGNATYTVTVTGNGGCTATATASVTVNANPVAVVTPAVVVMCSGNDTTITAGGGNTYAWSNNLGNNAAVTVAPSATTTYTVTVTNANNCTATATGTVTINPTPNAAINGPSTICSGLSATLTATGGSFYSWSNSLGNTASITVTPTGNTTYTVTVTSSSGCGATASQTVSVQSAPTAVISGNTTICSGESTTLTANGGNTYTWSGGLGTTAAITVSPTLTSAYTVTVSIGANCTATATQTVTVNQPNGSSLSQTLCFGESFGFGGNQLSTAGVYFDTLQNVTGCDSIVTLTLAVRPLSETNLQATICNGQTYTFNGTQLTQAGQYADTLQSVFGCDSFVNLNLLVVNQLTSTVSGSICQGETYQFNGLSLTTGGAYIDTLISTGGCDSIVTLNLVVNALPQPVVNAQANNLSTQTFSSYQWQLNGTDIPNANAQQYVATQNGNYTVFVTNADGCSATSAPVNVTGVGISEVLAAGVKIYPNPVVNMLTIETGAAEGGALIITDISGKLLLKANLTGKATAIDVLTLPAGVLYLRVETSTGVANTKLVKL